MSKIKSQEAAFRDHKKPKKAPKEAVVQNPAKPSGVKKNKARNERRKNARKVAALLRTQKMGTEVKTGESDNQDDEEKDAMEE